MVQKEKSKVLCYFDGASVAALRAALAEYPGDDTRVKIRKNDHGYELMVCDADGDGDAINDSHPCPGSPGCGSVHDDDS